jgi:hypothetical protein
MSQTKRASKGKRPSKAVSMLGIAGASWAASTSGLEANAPSQDTAAFQAITLDEEDISDVSLATFHVFDRENLGTQGSEIQLAARGGCGCGHGCGGCRGCASFGRGCGGCRGCVVGRGCAVGRGCVIVRWGFVGRGCGCGWGGCGGCGWGWGYCLSWGGCYPWC